MDALRIYVARLAFLVVSAVVLVVCLMAIGATSVGAGSIYYYSLLAETMNPTDSTIQFDNFLTGFLTTRTETSIPGNLTGYTGQVNLPDGATITGMGCEGIDSDPNHEFQIYLVRWSIDNSPFLDIISPAAGTGIAYQAGNTKVTGTITTDHGQQIVNNAVWAYNIFINLPKASPGTTLGVLRCRVDATYPVALPFVHR